MEPIAATDLEALLRRTLGDLLVKAVGPTWQTKLSKGIADALARTQEVAARNRDGVPDDPWLSAGLGDIKAVVEHFARELHERRARLFLNRPRRFTRDWLGGPRLDERPSGASRL